MRETIYSDGKTYTYKDKHKTWFNFDVLWDRT